MFVFSPSFLCHIFTPVMFMLRYVSNISLSDFLNSQISNISIGQAILIMITCFFVSHYPSL